MPSGKTYDSALDGKRLKTLFDRVFAFMRDGEWWTFRDIQVMCGGSEAGISARLRDFRKAKHGGHTVERRRLGDPRHGAYEYRLLLAGERAAATRKDAGQSSIENLSVNRPSRQLNLMDVKPNRKW